MRYPLVAMLGTFVIFSMANSFSTLFLNIYIWKQHSDLIFVGWFQFWSFLFTFVGIVCGAYLIRLVGSRLNFLCSALIALMLYTFLITADIQSLIHVGLAGMVNGLYIGLFFSGLNFYSVWFSEQDELSNVISLQYVINAIVQLITPPIAGWIIHFYGYDIAFITAICILFIQTLFSIATPQVKIAYPFRRKRFFIPENKKMAYVGFSAASFGFFYAFVHMSISIFIYIFVKSESTLGEWNMLFALFTIITYFFLGKSILRPYRETIGTLGVVISTVVTLSLFVPYPTSFIVFNVIISISLPMMWVPSFTHQFNTIKKHVELSTANPLTKMMELIVFREFTLCLGRISFLCILIFNLVVIQHYALSILILFLCFMPVSLLMLGKKAEYE